MNKIIKMFILVSLVTALSATCFAVNSTKLNTADALNELGLFLGTGNGYELEKGLTRAEGVTLLVRMIGMEETAKNGVYKNDFTDVPEWAAGYIGYAYENGITNGTSSTAFSPEEPMTDYMFLTLVLRALNYSDKGENALFVWDAPYKLAYDVKLIEASEADNDFSRADAITIFWNALDSKLYNSDKTLSARLVEQKVFSADELANAREIQKNGRQENSGVPVVPSKKNDEPKNDSVSTSRPSSGGSSSGGRPSGSSKPSADKTDTNIPDTNFPENNTQNSVQDSNGKGGIGGDQELERD